MKILLITDQHFGARNDSLVYVNKYKKFYSETVLPYIDKHKITQVIALGDTFDRRKYVNYSSLQAAKDMWFDPLRERDVKMHMLVGNHDIYYKNTLRTNSPELLLGDYPNITVVSDPTELSVGGLDILLLPWICDDNRRRSIESIESSNSTVCLGHLETNDFEPIPGYTMEHGDDPNMFSKFDLVCSGHYHHRSTKGNITYLNPYQMFWNDYGCDRGFNILNTDTKKLTFVKNPNSMFHKIYYRDSETAKIDYKKLQGSYVKLIVEKKRIKSSLIRLSKRSTIVISLTLKLLRIHLYTLMMLTIVLNKKILSQYSSKLCQEIDNKDEFFGILKSLYVEALRL